MGTAMALKTIAIGWWGPYTPEDVRFSDLDNGLYFLGGRRKYERQDQIQYFGITEGPYRKRLNQWHHAMGQITKNQAVCLGQIEYPRRFARRHLELAKGCLIYFWGPNLNRKKLVTPPEPVCLISRWLRPDGEPRKNRLAIYRELPDVVWWDSEYWRTGNLKPPYPDY
jgi:hypothetical protein